MSTQDTVNRIATIFGQLGTGVPSDELRRNLFQQLAEDFSQLAVDLGTDSGWTAIAGTATKGGGDTATLTTAQLAQIVKAIVDRNLATGAYGP